MQHVAAARAAAGGRSTRYGFSVRCKLRASGLDMSCERTSPQEMGIDTLNHPMCVAMTQVPGRRQPTGRWTKTAWRFWASGRSLEIL